MTGTLRLIALLFVLTCSTSAHAQQDVSCEGPLQSDAMRYPAMRVVPRIVRDLWAVPASAVAWDDLDWTRFGAVALPTVALMWPAHPSVDTQIERKIEQLRTRRGNRAFLYIDTIPISIALAGYGAALFGTAWLTGNDRLFEYGTLSVETLAVVQFWHMTAKLLLGRQGPYGPNGVEGSFDGPTHVHFPGGTPSGHAATTYGMLAVAAEYWDKTPLHVFAHAAALYASLSLIYHQQHFASDVIWGAAMGYFTARWVVRHRSSRYRCRSTKPLSERVLVLPVVAGQSFGVMFSLRL